MFRRPFRLALERAADVFTPRQAKSPIASVDTRMAWMRGGAILANARLLPVTAELAASGTPLGYWRGLHPRLRTEFELALLARGRQLGAGGSGYEVTVIGMRHARTLQRAARRLIAVASASGEKVIEIVHVEVSRRCGMTSVRIGAQPLRLQPALEDFIELNERSA